MKRRCYGDWQDQISQIFKQKRDKKQTENSECWLSLSRSKYDPLARTSVSCRGCYWFLDAPPHLYKRSCPSVRRSVRRSVRPSVRPSPVIFRRVLGASCAVYPALFPQSFLGWSTVFLFLCISLFEFYPLLSLTVFIQMDASAPLFVARCWFPYRRLIPLPSHLCSLFNPYSLSFSTSFCIFLPSYWVSQKSCSIKVKEELHQKRKMT